METKVTHSLFDSRKYIDLNYVIIMMIKGKEF